MGTTHWNGRTPEERLAKKINELAAQVTAVQSAGLHLPFVDTDPDVQYGNVWMFNDNVIRIRKPDGTIRQVVTTAPGGSTTGTPLPTPPAQKRTFQANWSASWSQTYKQDGSQRNENSLHVGYGDGYNGKQTSLIGWPYATISAALAGSTVTAVQVYLYCTHCWWNGGSTLGIGSHNNTAAPGSLSSPPGQVTSLHVQGADQGGKQGWHSVSTSLGAGLRSGTSKGIALLAAGNNATYYSVHAGLGSGLPVPQIKITYVR